MAALALVDRVERIAPCFIFLYQDHNYGMLLAMHLA